MSVERSSIGFASDQSLQRNFQVTEDSSIRRFRRLICPKLARTNQVPLKEQISGIQKERFSCDLSRVRCAPAPRLTTLTMLVIIPALFVFANRRVTLNVSNKILVDLIKVNENIFRPQFTGGGRAPWAPPPLKPPLPTFHALHCLRGTFSTAPVSCCSPLSVQCNPFAISVISDTKPPCRQRNQLAGDTKPTRRQRNQLAVNETNLPVTKPI